MEVNIISISIFLIIFLVYTIFHWKILGKSGRSTAAISRLPPSPPSLPLIGHLHLLSPYVHRALQNIASKYGPFLSIRIGSHPFLVVSSAAVAAEFFKKQDVNFAARPSPVFEDSIVLGSTGLVTAPYGDYWRFMRKLCVTELLGPQQIERSRGIRAEERERFLKKLLDKASKCETVDLLSEIIKLMNNSICRMAMSTTCLEEDSEVEKMIRELIKAFPVLVTKMAFTTALGQFKKLGLMMFGKEIAATSKKYDDLLEKILREHEERAEKQGPAKEDKDLMDIVLEAHRDDQAEFKITRTHIKSFLLDLFLGGTDTSSQATQWTMAELINHPNVFKKLRYEIERLTGGARLVQEADIPQLPYLRAVVKEILRLHPPINISSRLCCKSCNIGGYDIPENMVAFINLYAIMRDPELWKDPEDFIPERFLISDSTENEMERVLMSYIPFGGGRRACVGSHLALVFVSMAVAVMVQCFDWEVSGGSDDEGKVNMQEGMGMTLVMANPIKCIPILHFNPF